MRIEPVNQSDGPLLEGCEPKLAFGTLIAMATMKHDPDLVEAVEFARPAHKRGTPLLEGMRCGYAQSS
jgi:hypothetical protein